MMFQLKEEKDQMIARNADLETKISDLQMEIMNNKTHIKNLELEIKKNKSNEQELKGLGRQNSSKIHTYEG